MRGRFEAGWRERLAHDAQVRITSTAHSKAMNDVFQILEFILFRDINVEEGTGEKDSVELRQGDYTAKAWVPSYNQ